MKPSNTRTDQIEEAVQFGSSKRSQIWTFASVVSYGRLELASLASSAIPFVDRQELGMMA
jgi:hypothetical protein